MQLIGSRVVSETATTQPAAEEAASNGKQKRVVDLASVHDRLANRVGLLDKQEVLAVVGCTYPALWDWQRTGKFPLARVVFGKSKRPADVIADWLDGLPLRPLKPKPPSDRKIKEHEPV